MITIRQGDVFWCGFGPANGSAPAELHPCVVVQGDVFNRSRIGTTVVCLITSNLIRGEAPGNVRLRRGEAGLPKAGVVNVSQILTVDKLELNERIGRLPVKAMERVLNGLDLLFGMEVGPINDSAD